MCMGACMSMSAVASGDQNEGRQTPGAGVIYDCELPDMDTRS